MTDKEIMKALECCKMPVGSGACNGCPLKTVRDSLRKEDTKSCTTILLENALDLINSQKAEIERLQTEKNNLIRTYGECQKEVVKEFAERVKETDTADLVGEQYINGEIYGYFYSDAFERKIDNLVKEMTE